MLTWVVAFCAAINKVSAKKKAIFTQNSTHDSANGSMIESNIQTYDHGTHNGCVGG